MSIQYDTEYDMIFKIILIGDSSVGKTNIFTKYLHDEFDPDSKATVGVEFGTKNFKIEDYIIKVQIWDTAGQERYRSITNAYYKGVKGSLIVYDITNKESFDHIEQWLSELKTHGEENISIILLGNKSDLESNRQVTLEEGQKKAEFHKMAFMETSALNGDNIEKAFNELIGNIYKTNHALFKKKDNIKSNENTINLDNKEKKEDDKEEPIAKKGCCN